MAAIIEMAAIGWAPTAVSCESITASEPSRIALATSATSARVGRLEWIIELSICVAVIDGRAKRPASASTRFWTIGTSSMRISMPRSPRATITQSAALMISSARSTAWGFSILAISGSRVCWRTKSTSSARRTKESATRSTPSCSPNSSISRSRSGTEGRFATSPGMFRPWWEATAPPISTVGGDLAGLLVDVGHAQAHRAVGEVDDLLGAHRGGEPVPAHGEHLVRALGLLVAAADHDRAAGREIGDLVAHRADAQLRAREVLQDGQRTASAAGGGAQPLEGLGVLVGRAVGEVQPGHVHARLDHRDERVGVPRGGPDRGDDLGAAAHSAGQ